MSEYYLVHSDKYLAHHGILGQKWGRLNGPPYPLGSGDHSSKEASLAKRTGTKLGKSSGLGRHGGAAQLQNGKATSKKDKAKAEKRKQTLKKVAIGVGIGVGVAAVGYALYKHHSSVEDARLWANAESRANSAMVEKYGTDFTPRKATDKLVKNLSGIKVEDITQSEYTHMFDKDNGMREQDVNEAMEQAFRWNAFVDKYGTTNFKDIELNKGLDDMVKQHVNENADVKVFSKGQEGWRIAFGDAGKNFDVNKVKAGLYVTDNPEDRRVYRAVLGNPTGDSSAQRYEINFKAAKDIISPGGKKRAEITRDLFSDKSYRQELGKLLAGGNEEAGKNVQRRIEDTIRRAGAGVYLGNKYGNDLPMYYANWALVKGGSKPYQAYVDRVKKQGYNAIVDDHDILDKLGKQPVVLLDAKSNITNIGVKAVKDTLGDQIFAANVLAKRGYGQ